MKKTLFSLACFALLLTLCSTVLATDITLTTLVNNAHWDVPGNWEPNQEPVAGDRVFLNHHGFIENPTHTIYHNADGSSICGELLMTNPDVSYRFNPWHTDWNFSFSNATGNARIETDTTLLTLGWPGYAPYTNYVLSNLDILHSNDSLRIVAVFAGEKNITINGDSNYLEIYNSWGGFTGKLNVESSWIALYDQTPFPNAAEVKFSGARFCQSDDANYMDQDVILAGDTFLYRYGNGNRTNAGEITVFGMHNRVYPFDDDYVFPGDVRGTGRLDIDGGDDVRAPNGICLGSISPGTNGIDTLTMHNRSILSRWVFGQPADKVVLNIEVDGANNDKLVVTSATNTYVMELSNIDLNASVYAADSDQTNEIINCPSGVSGTFNSETWTGTSGSGTVIYGASNVWITDLQIGGAPFPPENVSATDGNFTNKVVIIWDESATATKYQVFRSDTNDTVTAIAISDTNLIVKTFDDTSANPGLIYFYWVKAGNNDGWSDFGASDSGYARFDASVFTWISTNSGGWNSASNWFPLGYPDEPGAVAILTNVLQAIGGADTDTLAIYPNGTATVGQIQCPLPYHRYQIGAGSESTVIFDNKGDNAIISLNRPNGNNYQGLEIKSSIILQNSLDVSVNPQLKNVKLTGPISGSGGLTMAGGEGTLLLGNDYDAVGPIIVNAGRLFLEGAFYNESGVDIIINGARFQQDVIIYADLIFNGGRYDASSGGMELENLGNVTFNNSVAVYPKFGRNLKLSGDVNGTGTLNLDIQDSWGDVLLAGSVSPGVNNIGTLIFLETSPTGFFHFGSSDGAVDLNVQLDGVSDIPGVDNDYLVLQGMTNAVLTNINLNVMVTIANPDVTNEIVYSEQGIQGEFRSITWSGADPGTIIYTDNKVLITDVIPEPCVFAIIFFTFASMLIRKKF